MQSAPTAPLNVSRTILALLVAGFALRLARPGLHSFWIDEGSSVMIARGDEFLAAMRADSHPPLSFLLWRGWGAVFGWSDVALRLFSAIVSCASLALFVPLARAWVGNRRAVWAVALYACAPLLVWIAHEVRIYAFLELATLLTFHAARAAWKRPSLGRWIALAACVALATGLHYYGSLVGLVVIAQAWLRPRASVPWSSVRATVFGAAVGVLVWLPWFLTILPAQYSNDWPRIARFSPRDLFESPPRLIAVDLVALVDHGIPWVGWIIGALCAFGLSLWMLFAPVRWRQLDSDDDASGMDDSKSVRALDALCAALIPIVASLILAACVQGGFQPRYLLTAVPGMVACVAGGLASLRPMWIARAANGLLLASLLALCALQMSENRREDYRSACREIAERFEPGDRLLVICCVPDEYVLATVDHYLRERPDILGSVLDTDAYLAGREPLSAGTRIHVIWREATICWQPFDDLRKTHRFVEEAPPRFRIHRILAVSP